MQNSCDIHLPWLSRNYERMKLGKLHFHHVVPVIWAWCVCCYAYATVVQCANPFVIVKLKDTHLTYTLGCSTLLYLDSFFTAHFRDCVTLQISRLSF